MLTEQKVIYCEKPQEWLWEQLGHLENEYIAKEYLKQRYQRMGIEHPDRLSFINVESFIFYLKQGRALFTTQSELTHWVEPLTLYYGMMNLLKAVMIAMDPTYPQQTSLLRHGCSTRKKKVQPYRFLQEEIRIQKEGLFPYLMQMLATKQPEINSYTPRVLLGMLPDLSFVYHLISGKQTFYPLTIFVDQTGIVSLQVNEEVLDRFHLTLSSWSKRFARFGSDFSTLFSAKTMNHHIVLTSLQPYNMDTDWTFNHPWVFQNKKGEHYLWVDNERPKRDSLPEILVFHMLLFSLSMLARYDSPLWGEMLVNSAEGAVIPPLFTLTKRRVPHLVWEELYQQKLRIKI